MKKLMFTLFALLTIAVQANAMSYEQARREALFLTDKMAYELNLTDAQYEAAYEINLDYLMCVTSRHDVFSTYWERRNLDLSYILYSWQWETFRAATYFYRPLFWEAGYWHFGIYARYPRRDYFYFGHPHFYTSYRGGHSWRMNGGRSFYEHRRDHFRPEIPGGRDRHSGMRDGWDRGDYRGRSSSSTRVTGGDNNRPSGNGRGGNGTFGRDNGNGRSTNGTFGRDNGNGRSTTGSLGRDNNNGNGRSTNGSFGRSSGTTRQTLPSEMRSTGTDNNRIGSSTSGMSTPSRSTSVESRSNSSTSSGSFGRSSSMSSSSMNSSRSSSMNSSRSSSMGSSHSSSIGSSRSGGSMGSRNSGGSFGSRSSSGGSRGSNRSSGRR